MFIIFIYAVVVCYCLTMIGTWVISTWRGRKAGNCWKQVECCHVTYKYRTVDTEASAYCSPGWLWVIEGITEQD